MTNCCRRSSSNSSEVLATLTNSSSAMRRDSDTRPHRLGCARMAGSRRTRMGVVIVGGLAGHLRSWICDPDRPTAGVRGRVCSDDIVWMRGWRVARDNS
ncbi:hypothetical protein [Lysobacter gummosus]|uniref:hypothetical protein n=1 Tax=Lysobacter gummosus TaxID=262324 RepID=UPI00362521FA